MYSLPVVGKILQNGSKTQYTSSGSSSHSDSTCWFRSRTSKRLGNDAFLGLVDRREVGFGIGWQRTVPGEDRVRHNGSCELGGIDFDVGKICGWDGGGQDGVVRLIFWVGGESAGVGLEVGKLGGGLFGRVADDGGGASEG